jgi:hypothetical protein
MSVFNLNKKSHIESLAFFDPAGGVTLQRYDTLKYRQFDKLTDKQLGFSGDQKKLMLDMTARTSKS